MNLQEPRYVEKRIAQQYQYMCYHACRHHDPDVPKRYLELNATKASSITLAIFHSINIDHALAEIERLAYETANEIFLIHNPKPLN